MLYSTLIIPHPLVLYTMLCKTYSNSPLFVCHTLNSVFHNASFHKPCCTCQSLQHHIPYAMLLYVSYFIPPSVPHAAHSLFCTSFFILHAVSTNFCTMTYSIWHAICPLFCTGFFFKPVVHFIFLIASFSMFLYSILPQSAHCCEKLYFYTLTLPVCCAVRFIFHTAYVLYCTFPVHTDPFCVPCCALHFIFHTTPF